MRYAGGGVGHTQIKFDNSFRPLKTSDLLPRVDEVVPDIAETTNDIAAMQVDEEQDEVLSTYEDGEDDSSTDEELEDMY